MYGEYHINFRVRQIEKHLKIIKLGNTQQIDKSHLRSLFYLIKNQIVRSRTSNPSKITFYLRIFISAFIGLLFYSAEIPVQLMLDLDKDQMPCANVADSKNSFSGNWVLASIESFLSPNQLRAETKNYKVYRNQKFFYSIEYPINWYPSGIVYSNAFEIRNYKSTNPQLVPEINRATLIVVDTTNTNPDATDKFLEGFLVGINTSERARRRLILNGHRAIRIRAEKPAQPLGPGASKTLAPGVVTESPKSYMTISTYIANGKHLISIEASAPENADASVKEEIIRISDSVKFDNSDSKQIKGETQ